MFRDNATDSKQRGISWNKLVQKTCLRQPATNAEPSTKQEKFKQARNTSKVLFDPTKSLQREAPAYLESYHKTGKTWHLKELTRILNEYEKDMEHLPPPSYPALRKFVDNEDTD